MFSVEGNRVFDGDVDTSVEGESTLFEEETATLRDGDGSITDCPGDGGFQWSYPTQLVVPEKFALTEKCGYRENWNLAACNGKYGKVTVVVKRTWDDTIPNRFDKTGQMKRHDLTAPEDTAVEDGTGKKTTKYLVILDSQKYYYTFQFLKSIPKNFRLDGRGIEKDAAVTVGVCLPENAQYGVDYAINAQDGNGKWIASMTLVDTIEDVMSDTTMSKVYKDGRFVYIRLYSDKPRDPNWDRHDTDHCAGRICPRFIVDMKKDLPFSTCFTPTEAEMSATEIMSQISRHECTLPPSTPDSDWGAGDSQDPDRDGQWGEWSSWADCCFPEGETAETTRYRVCDNPPRSGNGADCAGPSQETGQCQTPC